MFDPSVPVTIDVAPCQTRFGEHSLPLCLAELFSNDEALIAMPLFDLSSDAVNDAAFEAFIDLQLLRVREYRVELEPNQAGDGLVLGVESGGGWSQATRCLRAMNGRLSVGAKIPVVLTAGRGSSAAKKHSGGWGGRSVDPRTYE
ncbi:hypothetical protein PHYPSEUDO_004939 [Phytophthora pseudosyringae]|uniref:Uncharacterized protein n=1 Tax=Phytophthora pseudosyringae TaxID=221518 RepID=A0A8T1WGF7_9STRA|nr:hypothetical protein PHYPSEUDO_004939 [Phytophthora pseudosyringae]